MLLAVRISSYGCARELWRAREERNIYRALAESNSSCHSSFLSALQTNTLWHEIAARNHNNRKLKNRILLKNNDNKNKVNFYYNYPTVNSIYVSRRGLYFCI